MIRAWLREPLVHFLFAGLLMFLVLGGRDADPASRTIDIDEARVSQLAGTFAQTWQRPPRPDELEGLIRDFVRSEVYEREARRLGLDVDDEIIRRRLRSKMEFLVSSQIENLDVRDATLQSWLDQHPERYVVGRAVSFEQIYLGENGDGNAEKLRIEQGEDAARLGKASSLPRSMYAVDSPAIAREFGEAFAKAIAQLAPGQWQGPVSSGYGTHLVRIIERMPGHKPLLNEVRQQVENDWRTDTRRKREAAAYQALLDGYTIRIDRLE